MVKAEGVSEGNPSTDMSQPLPSWTETNAAAGGEDSTAAERPEETHTDFMGLSTGDQGKGSTEANTTQQDTAVIGPGIPELPSASKLCGYLHKQGGPLKTWKFRWFTYEENKCQLFYYRTAQDVNPLGRVELYSATFGYPLQSEEGTFHIQTPERTFVLKAANRDAKMYWLQQLQLRRLQHRKQLTAYSSVTAPQNCKEESQQLHDACSVAANFLPVVKLPHGLVGEEAARQPVQKNPLNVSIKHPLIEIQLQCDVNVLISTDSPVALEVAPADLSERMGPTAPRCKQLCDSCRSPASALPSGKKEKCFSATLPIDHKEDRAARLKQENLTLAEEVKAQKELVWLLHQALEAAQMEKRTCTQFMAAKGEQARLELLRHGQRRAADLQRRLERLRAESEALRQSLAERDAHVAELQDSLRLLLEKNQAKQEVILKLSEKVAACMDDPRHTLSFEHRSAEAFRHLMQETDGLKDDLEAYKTQNKFLNSEIHQLTKLWQNSSEQEKSLMVKCAYLEASNCQMESRYLGVLRKLQEKKELNAEQKDAVGKLIEEALQANLKDVLRLDTVREYDEYGFKILPDYEVEDMRLLAKIQALEIRSHNLLHRDMGEHSLLARWTQHLGGRSPDDLCPGPELKALLRAGVPRGYRPRVWRWMVRSRTRQLRNRHPDLFQQLCEKSHATPHPVSRQIQLDLHRTLTTNRHFCSPSSPQLRQLRRVLLAFSWHNPAVGYCQGLNRLAAIALLVLQSEEEAFWCLLAIVQFLVPQDYYTKTLLGSQADQRVFKDFMAEKMPRLVAHLEVHSVDVSLITFNWFLVVFVESLPSDILLKVWDAFFYEGTKVIFRYALALFKYNEEEILKIHDSVEIYQYLRFFTKTITDSRKLTAIAFGDLNPFPMKVLRNRRALHLQRLQAELRELERLQEEYTSENEPH
ncbi:hypothetical protein P4O66_015278, partial [Electrophorus voltai]